MVKKLLTIAWIFIVAIAKAQDGYFEQPTLMYSGHRLNQNSKAAAALASGVFISGEPLANAYILSVGVQGGAQAGTVGTYVRHSVSQTWSDGNVIPSELAQYDNFGYSVGATISTLLVGIRGDDDKGSSSGSAYVYNRSVFNPETFRGDAIAKLLASDGASNDFFGHSVSISGDWALVGAYGNDDLGSSSGSAYLFQRNQGGAENWGEVKKLLAPDGAGSNNFGREVKIFDTLAFVSSPSAQKVYMFSKNEGGENNWGYVHTITPSVPSTSFGEYLSLTNNYLLIGSNAERAFLFYKDAGGINNWGELQTLTPDPGEAVQYFGRSVEINFNEDFNAINVFVGSRLQNHRGINSGGVYWFQGAPGSEVSFKRMISASDVGNDMEFGFFVLASENDLFIGRRTTDGEVRHYRASSGSGTFSPNITGLEAEYVIPDYFAQTIFSEATVHDSDPTSLEVSLQLTNPTAGTIGAPFQLKGEVYYYTGTRSQVNNAFSNLVFTPADNLVPIGDTTYSNLIVKLDDFVNDPFQDTLSFKVFSSNEPPILSNLETDFYMGQDLGAIVGVVEGDDPDEGHTFSFTITEGNDYNLFAIDEGGNILLNNMIDPELHGTNFELQITATDNYMPDPKAGIGSVIIHLRDSILFNERITVAPLTVFPEGINYGMYASMNGDFAVIADRSYNGSASKVYAYRINDDGLTFHKEITPQSILSADYGGLLAMNEDWLFLSDPYDDELAQNAGSVAVFARHEGGEDNWGYVKKIIIPEMTSGSYFGYHIIVVNDRLFVSARAADTQIGQNTGAVYIFQKDVNGENAWGLEEAIIPVGLNYGDNFGSNISISNTGNTLAVCADADDEGGVNYGAVYIFRRNADGSFVQAQKILNNTGFSGSSMGCAVQDSVLVISATTNNLLGGIYQLDDAGNFILETQLHHSHNYQYPQSYVQVEAINNNCIIVSTHTRFQVWQKGWGLSSWGLVQKNDFASLISISKGGDRVLIGEAGRYVNYSPEQSVLGRVYLFDLKTEALGSFVINNPPDETTIFLPDSTGVRNSEILMPIFANDWNDVLGAQFSVAWDNTVATFVGVESFGLPGMDLSSFNLSNAADGYFSFAWSDPTITAQSLPDTTALFYIRFILTGDFGSTTPVAITHYPVAIEVISEDYEQMEVIRIDGVLNISSDITIQGTVRYSNNEAVQNVTIELSGASELETATNTEGQYRLTFEPAESEEGIVITPSKGSDPNLLNGIDVQDVASIRRHILRTESLTTAYQVIAADVSNNGIISIQDVILLQALILGIETDFPSGTQWTFVDAAHTFTNALTPFPYPQTLEVDLATLTAEDNFNFTAVKIGDVTMDRDNTQTGRTKGQEVVLEISAPEKKDDGTYEVSITTLGFVDVSAYQFTIVWDAAKLEFINVVNEGTQGVYGEHKVSEGLLTTLWDDDNGASLALADQTQLFKLRFNAIDENDLGLIEVTDQLTSMRMFDNQLNKIEFSVRQQVNESKASGNFYPNPFEEMINISFTLKEAQSVKIEILNDLGQKIGAVEDYYEKGWNEVKIDGSNFKKGLYLFSINVGGKREVTKLIKK